ncbi:MAG: GNAT family N-acetyltransferase [Candidatus Dormibacteria bacterium]
MVEPARVYLRPVELRDLEVCRRVDTEPALTRPFEWPGFHHHEEHLRRWEEDGYLSPDDSMLAVAAKDGACAGFVSWAPVRTMGPTGGCIEVGILLLPEYRGQGMGWAAQRELAEYLFATTLAHRIQASTDVENAAERRALERAGFTFEGILRGVSYVEGEWRDDALYGCRREDQESARG